jgi:hypothetical protein
VKVADKDGLLSLNWAARTHSNVKVVQYLWEQYPQGFKEAETTVGCRCTGRPIAIPM